MEVRSGHKQTEVGVIPTEWSTSTVGREFEIKLGKMLDVEKNAGLPKPYLNNKAVQWDRIDILDLQTIAIARSELERFRLRRGDLLVCEGGEVGRAAIWDAPIEDCYYQKALHRLRPLRGFDSRLMIAFLRYWSDHGLLANYVTQTSIAHLTREKFAEVPMPVPPPAEQRAIAVALSDVDALLAKLDQLIAKKRDLKQAAMQHLLTGQSRLPGFSGKWEVKRLGGIADCLDNLRVPLNEVHRGLMKGDYPYCGANGVLGFVNDYVIDDDIILMAEDGGYFDEYATRPIAYRMVGKCWVNNHAHILKAKADFDQRFIFYSLVHKNILSYLASGTRAKLNKSEMKRIEVCLPMAKDEQRVIATVLSDMDAEIAALEARRDKTRAVKQGMMQELLTGKIRLVQPETKPENAMPAHDELRKAANDGRNWAFNEAVIISVLAENFADASHPLGRMRYTKLSYLLHRYANEDTEGYLKKAAGPYNPATRYKGPERIAQTSGYVKAAKAGNLNGFVAGEQAYKARTYFDKWYGPTALEWLRQFRYEKNEALELLTTVDKAVEELRSAGKEVTVQSVKEVLLGEPEWKPKLERPVFSDEHIQAAILRCQRLFGAG